jgi:hypothetical protein
VSRARKQAKPRPVRDALAERARRAWLTGGDPKVPVAKSWKAVCDAEPGVADDWRRVVDAVLAAARPAFRWRKASRGWHFVYLGALRVGELIDEGTGSFWVGAYDDDGRCLLHGTLPEARKKVEQAVLEALGWTDAKEDSRP